MRTGQGDSLDRWDEEEIVFVRQGEEDPSLGDVDATAITIRDGERRRGRGGQGPSRVKKLTSQSFALEQFMVRIFQER